MTRLLTAGALIAALTVPAASGSRSYYGANGSYAGSSIIATAILNGLLHFPHRYTIAVGD
jgi:hypothetical protein